MKIIAWFLLPTLLVAFVAGGCSLYRSEGRECLEKGPSCIDYEITGVSTEKALQYCYPSSQAVTPKLLYQQSKWISWDAFEEVKAVSGFHPKEDEWQIILQSESLDSESSFDCRFRFQDEQEMQHSRRATFIRGLDYIHKLTYDKSP